MIESKKGVSNIISIVFMIGIVLVAFLAVYNIVNIIFKQKTSEVSSGFDNFLNMLGFSAGGKSGTLNPLTDNIILASGESCYIELDIGEKKIRDIYNSSGDFVSQEIEFSFLNVTSLFGSYESLVNYYNKEMPSFYILRTYDGDNTLIANFSVNSGRFIFYDDFGNATNPGGVIELNESMISAVIPYDKRIAKIKMEYSGNLTDLNVNPANFKCERTCKIENESLTENERCCLGFVKSMQNDSSYRCVKCGDGICSPYEDEYSCYKDCGGNFTCPSGYNKTEFGCDIILLKCGNGICESGENCYNCLSDCGCSSGRACINKTCIVQTVCGNNICESTYGEDCSNCASDCGCSSGRACINKTCIVQTVCGNGICESGESYSNCPQDCHCGNGICESGEDYTNCSQDCPYCSVEALGFGEEYGCGEGYGADGYGCGYGIGYVHEGKPCTLGSIFNGVCFGGDCVECTQDSQCNGGNECTNDYCAENRCQHSYNDGSICGNSYGVCENGACNFQCTQDSDCNDGNPCTYDFCDSSYKCQYGYWQTDGSQCGDGGNSGTCYSGACIIPVMSPPPFNECCYNSLVCEAISEANCNSVDCYWDGSSCVPSCGSSGCCSSYTDLSSCRLNGGGNTGCSWNTLCL